jgi:hypothetical protein
MQAARALFTQAPSRAVTHRFDVISPLPGVDIEDVQVSQMLGILFWTSVATENHELIVL